MARVIVNLVIGSLGVLFGVLTLISVFKKHRRIDTESVAVVKEVQDLGRSDGHKVYAIKYTVKSSNPFELLKTPCKNKLAIGTERSIFYEKENPKENHYFKLIGQFDRRFVLPCVLIFAGVSIIVSAVSMAIG